MSDASDVKEPTITRCWYCDFGAGRRGMDTCRFCKGTGSLFIVKLDNGGSIRTFPNTKEGHELAVFALQRGGHF